jgi:hypothetical protein
MIHQLLIALALTSVAHTEEKLSTAAAQAQVAADTGCQRHDYPALETTLYVGDRGLTFWYFTVPSASVPPGYIRRSAVQRDGAWSMETTGYYDGTDAQQADFDAWTRRLVASFPH